MRQLMVENLVFNVMDNLETNNATVQPKVTIRFDTRFNTERERYKQALNIQTTVSSRNYRNN